MKYVKLTYTQIPAIEMPTFNKGTFGSFGIDNAPSTTDKNMRDIEISIADDNAPTLASDLVTKLHELYGIIPDTCQEVCVGDSGVLTGDCIRSIEAGTLDVTTKTEPLDIGLVLPLSAEEEALIEQGLLAKSISLVSSAWTSTKEFFSGLFGG
mgnify:CR=1 FL=1